MSPWRSFFILVDMNQVDKSPHDPSLVTIRLPFHTWKHNHWVNGFTVEQLLKIRPGTVFDVGIGDGFYAKLIKFFMPSCTVFGVELNKRWVSHCESLGFYDRILQGSIVDSIRDLSGDLIIFGDILEHLEKDDMRSVLKTAVTNFRFVIVNSPLGFQEQHHEESEEIHRCGIERADFAPYDVLEFNESHFVDSPNNMLNCLVRGRALSTAREN
jgi:hypothetical protein